MVKYGEYMGNMWEHIVKYGEYMGNMTENMANVRIYGKYAGKYGKIWGEYMETEGNIW